MPDLRAGQFSEHVAVTCNGNQHYNDCDCGFGGVTRSGAVAYAAITHGYRETPLRALACELGVSITVPRCCWYCDRTIFLYAAPDGGFAIFDSLGPPWPKHYCTGYPHQYETRKGSAAPRRPGSGRATTQHHSGIHVSMPAFRIPVPAGTPYASKQSPGLSVRGVIVSIERGVLVVFDGSLLWRLHVHASRDFADGEWVEGQFERRGGFFIRHRWRPEPPPLAVKN